jgi:hypothetical protein
MHGPGRVAQAARKKVDALQMVRKCGKMRRRRRGGLVLLPKQRAGRRKRGEDGPVWRDRKASASRVSGCLRHLRAPIPISARYDEMPRKSCIVGRNRTKRERRAERAAFLRSPRGAPARRPATIS